MTRSTTHWLITREDHEDTLAIIKPILQDTLEDLQGNLRNRVLALLNFIDRQSEEYFPVSCDEVRSFMKSLDEKIPFRNAISWIKWQSVSDFVNGRYYSIADLKNFLHELWKEHIFSRHDLWIVLRVAFHDKIT